MVSTQAFPVMSLHTTCFSKTLEFNQMTAKIYRNSPLGTFAFYDSF